MKRSTNMAQAVAIIRTLKLMDKQIKTDAEPDKSALAPGTQPTRAGFLRRKCACGGSAGVAGKCEGCSYKQLKVQRRAVDEAETSNIQPIAHEAIRATGQSPDQARRSFMEPSFGHDFGRVHVYPNGDARAIGRSGRVEAARAQSWKSLFREAHHESPAQGSGFSLDQKPEAALEPPPVAEEQPPVSLAPDTAEPLQGGPTTKPQPAPAANTKVVSKTVATTPADRTRKKIGLGEDVTCSTDPATAANWTVTGGGAVSPASGNSTTFTASKSPSKPTVTATVGTNNIKTDFEVVAPNGINSTVSSNTGVGTPGPPNDEIGFETIFDCTVQPTTVSFYNVQFRENIPKDTWTWPDGTADSNGPKDVPWTVGQNNKTTDTVSSGILPATRLMKSGTNTDINITIHVPEDYKDDAGTWVTWLPGEEHFREFKGANLKSRGTLKATNSASGTWQGPWQ